MRHKIFRAPFILKQDEKDSERGEFMAVFSTLNVIDHDGDVTEPGAFKDGQQVIIEPWNHAWNLPAGKGIIQSDDEKAWVEGEFFLDTEAGRENYRTVKNLGSLAEWSYTFDVLEQGSGDFENEQVNFLRSLDVVGVSPVTRGAGIETETVGIKQRKQAIASHSTATTDAAWDGPANEARLRTEESASYYRKAYAWKDPDGDPETKSAYKFIHHQVDGDGKVDAANVRACQTGIGVLNGARGGTTIQEADRQGVYNHLAKHLKDADLEPPELKSLDDIEDEDDDVKSRGVSSEVIKAQIDIIGLSVLSMED